MVVAPTTCFDYRELRIATQAVLRGAELVGVTRDRTFPMPDGPWPASGPLLAAVEQATGVDGDAHGRQAGAGDVRGGARPARRPGRYLAVATGSTPTSWARAAGMDARSC